MEEGGCPGGDPEEQTGGKPHQETMRGRAAPSRPPSYRRMRDEGSCSCRLIFRSSFILLFCSG